MSLIVQKFGGTSVANTERLKNVADIVTKTAQAGNQVVVVVSAQGDTTDDLIVKAAELNDRPSKREMDVLLNTGEMISMSLLAMAIQKLGFPVVSLTGWQIGLETNSNYSDARIKRIAGERLKAELDNGRIVIVAGFQGINQMGDVTTLGRGGSDTTAVAIAATLGADLCQIYTDVDGVYTADPRIVKHARKIDTITYKELRELSYMGASVLHEDSIFPVYQAAIPINVRNTNDPKEPGTMIVPTIEGDEDGRVTGIAGKKHFTVLTIEKNGMNAELGFGRRVLASIEKYSIPFEHMPSSIDTLSVVLEDSLVKDNINDIIDDIHRVCEPDSVEVVGHIALIATVGRSMVNRIGTAATLFSALADAGVNVRMIDQGSSEMNIIVGVSNDDFERAINAIHDAFAGKEERER